MLIIYAIGVVFWTLLFCYGPGSKCSLLTGLFLSAVWPASLAVAIADWVVGYYHKVVQKICGGFR